MSGPARRAGMSGEGHGPAEGAAYGSGEFAADTNVSRETLVRLGTYAALLEDWNSRFNLVAAGTIPLLWRRHFLDSAQLLPFIPPSARTMVDLGSGAGFPGLVIAEMLRQRPGFRTVLYEATGKKAKFLKEVTAHLGLAVEVRGARVEAAEREIFDVVMARALAPLPKLAAYAQRFWGPKTVGLFLKGQNVEGELTEARKSWRMEVARHESRSDPSGVILEVRELRRAD